MDKKTCRHFLRAKRKQISMASRLNAARLASLYLIESPLFIKSNHISAYMAKNDEFDCGPLIRAIWNSGKQCYLPVLAAPNSRQLEFVAYREEDPLRPNRYGILEPLKGEVWPADHLDLVLVPLVGFDRQGRRLGMGAGYYDHTFAFLQTMQQRSCCLIGVGFAVQQVPRVPEDPWDVLLDGVLTEDGLMMFG